MGTTLPLGVFTEDRPMEDHSASASASAKWISLRKQSSAKETLVSIPRTSRPTMASWGPWIFTRPATADQYFQGSIVWSGQGPQPAPGRRPWPFTHTGQQCSPKDHGAGM
ncbi:hypothetical protein E0198_000646 [Clavispora lusitaniae]|nr:hypothetical protein E0198_000646 [Clavispora lusitaniae]